ncbi:class I SAM-dependent methyltransferase [Bdellovibrio sp. HCB337]|uniref:class I SAM-dependent methyltransferase n=1 Tax=Bdellovibrio sp. HCB337 TaxID=3394358 RepID=UPI0039A52543
MTDNQIRVTLKGMGSSHSDFIFTQKPSGYNTHSPDIGKKGYVEILSEKLQKELLVVHRLDKETSGAMLFATNKPAAAELSSLFEKHLIYKKYLFLTDRKIAPDRFEYESTIEKDKGKFVNISGRTPNSKTLFTKLKSLGPYELWQAEPTTGKPHQIRLHAEACGIPILGCKEHGGSAFYRLCLHADTLSFEYKSLPYHFQAELPVWVNELDAQPNIEEEELMILEAFQKRQWLLDFKGKPSECFRLSHQDIDSYRVDMFGEYLWFYWYKDNDPSTKDLERFQRVADRFGKKYFVRKMLNRGEDPNAQLLWPSAEKIRWVSTENAVKFECRNDTGLSPGLFLDQRENRRWVREHSKDKCVLNLFSYTGGFSVNAALGGAKEVVTVDVSSNFLEWSKKNFEVNGLSLTPPDEIAAGPKMDFKTMMSDQAPKPRYEFWVQDSIIFLKGTARRKRKFDVIICDPPSFGRSKSGTFSISKNYEELIVNCLYCLAKGGLLLFCTNYEKWTQADLVQNIQKLKSQFYFTVLSSPGFCLDFELPDEDPLMKSVIIRKN